MRKATQEQIKNAILNTNLPILYDWLDGEELEGDIFGEWVFVKNPTFGEKLRLKKKIIYYRVVIRDGRLEVFQQENHPFGKFIFQKTQSSSNDRVIRDFSEEV